MTRLYWASVAACQPLASGLVAGVLRPVLELLDDVRDLGLDVGRDLRVEGVERRDAGGAVEVARLDGAVLDRLEQRADAVLLVLLSRGDQARVRSRQRVPLVEVDADAEELVACAARLRRLLESAVTGVATGTEDEVRALREHLLGLA